MNAIGLALASLVGVSLGFFGGGGSILTVPLLVYVFRLDAKQAIASSLVIVAVASLTGAFSHLRSGNVRLRTAALFGSAGITGAYGGGRASALIDGEVLLLLFASIMVLAAVAMWRGRRGADGEQHEERARSLGDTMRLLGQGAVVGGFTGLVGAGGGFLIVPALSLWAGLPMQAAIGTSLVVIVMNCIAGFSGYATHVSISPMLVSSVAASAVIGSVIGARLARRVPPASLRRGFAVFVSLMGAMILLREGPKVAAAAADALPQTAPQLLFVLIALGIGILAGRASRRGGRDLLTTPTFEQGDGI
jgi:uncharacterized membrane protein YfcA